MFLSSSSSGALKEQDFASGKNSKIATRHIKNLKNWRQETNGLMMMEGTGFLFRIEDIHIHPTIHNIMMLCLCTYCIGGGGLWLVHFAAD